jgi:hypothetical protein
LLKKAIDILGERGNAAAANAAVGTMKGLATDRPFGESLAEPFLGSEDFQEGLTDSVAKGVRSKIDSTGLGELFLEKESDWLGDAVGKAKNFVQDIRKPDSSSAAPAAPTAPGAPASPGAPAAPTAPGAPASPAAPANKSGLGALWDTVTNLGGKAQESLGRLGGQSVQRVKTDMRNALQKAVDNSGKAIGEHVGSSIVGTPGVTTNIPGASPFAKGLGEEFAANASKAVRTNANLDTMLGIGANLFSGDFGGLGSFLSNKAFGKSGGVEDYLTEEQGREVGKAYQPATAAMQGFSDKITPLVNTTATKVLEHKSLGLNNLGKGIGDIMQGNLGKAFERFLPSTPAATTGASNGQ